MSHFLGAIKDLLVLSAFCVPVSGVRRFCVRYYDQLCAVWILSSHVLDTVSSNLILWFAWPLACALLCYLIPFGISTAAAHARVTTCRFTIW
jgi:hypothetical protein